MPGALLLEAIRRRRNSESGFFWFLRRFLFRALTFSPLTKKVLFSRSTAARVFAQRWPSERVRVLSQTDPLLPPPATRSMIVGVNSSSQPQTRLPGRKRPRAVSSLSLVDVGGAGDKTEKNETSKHTAFALGVAGVDRKRSRGWPVASWATRAAVLCKVR